MPTGKRTEERKSKDNQEKNKSKKEIEVFISRDSYYGEIGRKNTSRGN